TTTPAMSPLGNHPETSGRPGVRSPFPSAAPAASHPSVALPSLSWVNVSYTSNYFGGPAEYFGAMAFDPLLGEVILMGGCGYVICPLGDTWGYSDGSWYNLTSSLGTAPAPRYGHMMDFDPALGGIVLFGGRNLTGVLYDTWLFTGVWTNITGTVGIPAGGNAFSSMAWDPALQGVLLVNGCATLICTSEWSGTWLLNASGWNIIGLGPQGLTSGTAYASMAYDAADGYMLYFGGWNTHNQVNWTYTYSAGAWTNITMNDAGCFFVCFTAPGRWLAAMTWDQQEGAIFMTGGGNSTSGSFYNDSWVFGRGTWFPADLFGPTEPAAYGPVDGQAMAVNSTGIAAFVAGGQCGSLYCLSNDWVWELPPAIANYTVTPNPVDDNAPITVYATGVAGYGSGPVQRANVGWGNFWFSTAFSNPVNFTVNWSASTYYYYGANSPAGTYHASVTPFDWFDVFGPAWNFNVTVNSNLSLTMGSLPSQVEAGKAVSFSATASNGTAPYAYSWQFGDSRTGTGASTTHTFTAPGTYDVNVTATDAGAGTNTTNATLHVLPALSVTASAGLSALDVGTSDSFTGVASGGTGTYSYYNWSWGDGGVAHTASATHSYTTPGTYHVSLTATDSLGYTAVHNLTIVVNAALAAAPTATPTSVDTGANVSFAAAASSGTAPYTYTWQFGDGATSSAATPTHKYSAAGTYTVSLWVNDSGGGSVHKTLTVTVSTPSSSSSSTLAGLPVWLWIVIVIVVVAALLGAVLAMRRRRSPPAPPSPMTPPGATPSAAPPPPAAGGGPPPGAM
ncbi:MAG TPA: PKD domain-containing protein, partial [Thermoplasmata archaeon]|nr:PKD domain-containing protein [Thermoplasmata archaeon]